MVARPGGTAAHRAQGRLPELPAKEEGTGLDHKGYLRLMLFAGYCTEYVYRMMDVMQMKICRNQTGFRMSHCVCKVDMEAAVCGKPVFFRAGRGQKRENCGWRCQEAIWRIIGNKKTL